MLKGCNMSFDLITLRFYHDGALKKGRKPYIGGDVTDFLDVNLDKFSHFELRDCVKDLGYDPGRCLLFAFVYHMVEGPQIVPPLLEYVSHVEEDSVVSIDKGTSQDIGGSEETSDAFDAVLEASFEETPHIQTVQAATSPNSSPLQYTPPPIHAIVNVQPNITTNHTSLSDVVESSHARSAPDVAESAPNHTSL
ncbi:hypothetical protein K7X08_022605 [Anisodus acutangulus]|uniref:PB1-like domain-containing protein n=1 Tax=Anisodus acutangulus TaxID=402998 RepID=A0A9Q1RKM4_9SOLA|nr:hypothetical protein K7X08_022605 [Anisodus acutangulus]